MNNKRGSAIAEASIVFPVVIVAVLMVIYILIVLYTDASEGVRDRVALRNEAGLKTETIERKEGIFGIMPEDKFGQKPFLEAVEISESMRLLDKLLLTDRSRVYVIDEVEYIRRVNFIQNLGGSK